MHLSVARADRSADLRPVPGAGGRAGRPSDAGGSYEEKFLQDVLYEKSEKDSKDSKKPSKLVKTTDILTLIVSIFTIGIIFSILIGIIFNMFIKSIK